MSDVVNLEGNVMLSVVRREGEEGEGREMVMCEFIPSYHR